MKYLEQQLRKKNKYTNYQVKQIIYLVKAISSELSKIIIMAVLFKNHIPAYFAALTILFFLRSFSGGLHFNTYAGCLIATITYFFLAIMVLPSFTVPFAIKFSMLIVCMIMFSRLTPVTSKYRPPLSQPKIIICQNITTTFTFLFTIILYIIPDNPYVTVGFWIIILHLLQLLTSKLLLVIKRKKGGTSSC